MRRRAMKASHFTRFAVADWSGAKGSKHKGIALAICDEGDDVPILVEPPNGGVWSREEIAQWVEAHADEPLLIGFDFSFAPPLIERGSYLPGDDVPETAKAFWAYVDRQAIDDPDLGAASFLESAHRRHFYFGAADGRKADFVFWRECDRRLRLQGGIKSASAYDAIGAAQVAKASFAGMRLLHRLSARLPVWPFDPAPKSGAMVIEIYTAIAARAAGLRKGRSKFRTVEALNEALAQLGSKAVTLETVNDHQADAILTAAWLRRAATDPANWNPPALTSEITNTEGWTFGVV